MDATGSATTTAIAASAAITPASLADATGSTITTTAAAAHSLQMFIFGAEK